MKAKYFDPMFYICSDKMPFSIRIIIRLKDKISKSSLQLAVNKAQKRYPYFCIKVIEQDGELITVENPLPLVTYEGPDLYPLGSDEVNGHMLALSYYNDEINFHISHVITDGAGMHPFIKTVLYYYLCDRYNTKIDDTGVNLSESPFFDDEIGNPYPEEKIKAAQPFYECPKKDFFRLIDGGYVNDEKGTVFRLKIRESDVVKYSHDNDGSPCVLISSLMTKGIWDVHKNMTKDIVSAVSFNQRPALGNLHNYRMLCSAIMLRYPNSLRNAETAKLCTCSRGMVSVQSQEENVFYDVKQKKQMFENLQKFNGVEEIKAYLGELALSDSINNTFSVSYVGRLDWGGIQPYLDTIYNYTDGSTYKTVFIEITSTNGWFDIAFLQGFSSDIYYRSFKKQLEQNGLEYKEEDVFPLEISKIVLP